MANLLHLPQELVALGVVVQILHKAVKLTLRAHGNVTVRVKWKLGINPCPPSPIARVVQTY